VALPVRRSICRSSRVIMNRRAGLVFDSLSTLALPLGEFGAMVGATIVMTLGLRPWRSKGLNS
jgi:hypothetical protein